MKRILPLVPVLCLAVLCAARAEAGPSAGLLGRVESRAACATAAQAGEAGGDEFFRVPYPERVWNVRLRKPERVEYFSELFRVGVSSGVLIPLLYQEALYNFGWWSKLTLHREFDLGLDLFRTMAELSGELGQSTSSRIDQDWRIVSSLYFFKLRILADFLPEQPGDLYVFAGLGLGFERAEGHQQTAVGFERIKELNISPLLEGGGGVTFSVSRNFQLDFRLSTTWPVTSANILLYLNVEMGFFLLFH